MGLWTRKSIETIQADAVSSVGPQLQRALGVWNLTSIGVGCTIGAGIFVLTGTAAADYAGPAVSISFVLAALACLCAALCYGELASMIPAAGSAYTYAYATMGQLIAWIIGWNLVLEYLIAASTVAVGWSGYFTAFLEQCHVHLPPALASPPVTRTESGGYALQGGIINLPAVAIVLASTAVLAHGIRESARANNVMVLVKLLVIVLVIGFGARYVDTSNWHPFVPQPTPDGNYGWSGVFRAAGIVFFSYIGFDAISTSAQEARDPQRTVPISLLLALAVCTVLYCGMSLVMTGLAHYSTLRVAHPVDVAIDGAGSALAWLKPVVSVGAIIGLGSAVLTTLYGQTRIFYAMAHDGLIPTSFGRINNHSQVPVVGTWYTGIFSAAVAGLFPIDILGELVSIGTLMAFAIVCIGVLMLRRSHPSLPRAFKVPLGPIIPLAGALLCVGLMLSLPHDTWLRLAIWLAFGFAIYFGYGRKHARNA